MRTTFIARMYGASYEAMRVFCMELMAIVMFPFDAVVGIFGMLKYVLGNVSGVLGGLIWFSAMLS